MPVMAVKFACCGFENIEPATGSELRSSGTSWRWIFILDQVFLSAFFCARHRNLVEGQAGMKK